jgi:hypothetical protein
VNPEATASTTQPPREAGRAAQPLHAVLDADAACRAVKRPQRRATRHGRPARVERAPPRRLAVVLSWRATSVVMLT